VREPRLPEWALSVFHLRLRAMRPYSTAIFGLLFFLAMGNVAGARPAQCTTTDDGTFLCEFRTTAEDGSFEISAPGKPTYTLNVIEPGAAFGFVNFGPQNIPLPGRYLRSQIEPSCWVNESTRAKLCAQ